MVYITEELIRKRSEHNDKIISTLEELSLHQENIEKIDHIQNWCKNLEILLLQGNLVSKIENLHKLKKLRYLNLAINNIERIENLEGLESLEKLDLTLNFIGELTSVSRLKANTNLKQLILSGNPCIDFQYYRDYVVNVLPDLCELDCVEITRTERILTAQELKIKEREIRQSEKEYIIKRSNEKAKAKGFKLENVGPDEIERFWKEPSGNTPEERVNMAKIVEMSKQSKTEKTMETIKPVQRFNKEGKPLNINKAKIGYDLTESPTEIILDVAVYKYLDTGHITVDVQPTYVSVFIKEKLLQLTLSNEVDPMLSTCQRSLTTGHLIITMPKIENSQRSLYLKKTVEKQAIVGSVQISKKPGPSKRELLEIGSSNPTFRSTLKCIADDIPDLE